MACVRRRSSQSAGAGDIGPKSIRIFDDQDQRAVLGKRKGRARYQPYTIPYAGGELRETNIGLMPGHGLDL